MDVKNELKTHGAIYEGHFVGNSGAHLAGYCNIDPVLPFPALINSFARMMVEPYKDKQIETVITPATGAIPFAHLGALHLIDLTGEEVQAVWADKTKDAKGQKQFTFERNGHLDTVKGKKVLILEDMINRMHTIKKVVSLVKEVGGEIVGVASVASNGGVSAKAMGVPQYNRLCLVEYDTWTPAECAKSGLCAKKQPIVVDIGHGGEYEMVHPEYKGGYVTLAELD